MKFNTTDGRKLTYRKMGKGPVLVCHPGGPGFSSSYFSDLAGLYEKFTLVMLNPRGTGGSDRPADPQAYRIEDYVSDGPYQTEERPSSPSQVTWSLALLVADRVSITSTKPPAA